MKLTTMKDILAANNISRKESKNPAVTRQLAEELRAKGYRPAVRRISGKPTRVWIKGGLDPETMDFKTLLETALEHTE